MGPDPCGAVNVLLRVELRHTGLRGIGVDPAAVGQRRVERARIDAATVRRAREPWCLPVQAEQCRERGQRVTRGQRLVDGRAGGFLRRLDRVGGID